MIIGVTYLGTKSNIFSKTILTQIYGPIICFQSRQGADPDFLKRGGKQGGPNPNFPSFLKIFRQKGDLPSPVDYAPSPVMYNPVLDVSISQKIFLPPPVRNNIFYKIETSSTGLYTTPDRVHSLQEGEGPRFGEKPLKTTTNLGLGPPICPLF